MSGKINAASSPSQSQSVGAASLGQASRNMSGAGAGAGAMPAGANAADAQADSVAITGAASEIATAEQSLGAIPVVNESRVGSIRGAIEAGTYKVQPQKVASQLIDFERDLPEPADTSDSL